MDRSIRNNIFEEIIKTIEIPDSAYETAEKRYKDLGVSFSRPESNCSRFDPHIYAQGSFRLGTVVRPLDEDAPFDLDLACNLRKGLTKRTHTQEQLANLVGLDVEAFRVARKIDKPTAKQHRCWRLIYADALSFHMDVVPCIPEETERRGRLKEAMVKRGSLESFAEASANLTVSITDDRNPNYRSLSNIWNISNPEGYARWFESRMMLATTLLEKRLREAKVARVDQLPTFRWKSPLQRCVQILKRHRDIRFKDNQDSKPISIIISTLAARAYNGESDTGEALERIVYNMGAGINSSVPRVPNPVDPDEDFADKWPKAEGQQKQLEKNFRLWLEQAKADFENIGSSTDTGFITEQAMHKFGSRLESHGLRDKLGITAPFVAVSPKSHRIVETPAKPWQK